MGRRQQRIKRNKSTHATTPGYNPSVDLNIQPVLAPQQFRMIYELIPRYLGLIFRPHDHSAIPEIKLACQLLKFSSKDELSHMDLETTLDLIYNKLDLYKYSPIIDIIRGVTKLCQLIQLQQLEKTTTETISLMAAQLITHFNNAISYLATNGESALTNDFLIQFTSHIAYAISEHKPFTASEQSDNFSLGLDSLYKFCNQVEARLTTPSSSSIPLIIRCYLQLGDIDKAIECITQKQHINQRTSDNHKTLAILCLDISAAIYYTINNIQVYNDSTLNYQKATLVRQQLEQAYQILDTAAYFLSITYLDTQETINSIVTTLNTTRNKLATISYAIDNAISSEMQQREKLAQQLIDEIAPHAPLPPARVIFTPSAHIASINESSHFNQVMPVECTDEEPTQIHREAHSRAEQLHAEATCALNKQKDTNTAISLYNQALAAASKDGDYFQQAQALKGLADSNKLQLEHIGISVVKLNNLLTKMQKAIDQHHQAPSNFSRPLPHDQELALLLVSTDFDAITTQLTETLATCRQYHDLINQHNLLPTEQLAAFTELWRLDIKNYKTLINQVKEFIVTAREWSNIRRSRIKLLNHQLRNQGQKPITRQLDIASKLAELNSLQPKVDELATTVEQLLTPNSTTINKKMNGQNFFAQKATSEQQASHTPTPTTSCQRD